MRYPKGWTLAGVSDHLATVSGEYDAAQDVGMVRVHLLTKTVGRSDPQTFVALAWEGPDGADRFQEVSEDDLSERVPPETARLEDGGYGFEPEGEFWWITDAQVLGRRPRAYAVSGGATARNASSTP